MKLEITAKDITDARQFITEHASNASPVGDPLFVYGTLKHGGHNHRYLGHCRFLGEAETVGSFPLEHICLLPVLGQGYRVQGEVYVPRDAAAWAVLDRLEGHPYQWRRLKTQVEVKIKNQEGVPNKFIEAWVYFFMGLRSGNVVNCAKEYKIY